MQRDSGTDQDRVVVLGQQIADAREAERKRLESPPGPSPMPAASYDVWRGELRLANPTRVELDDAIAGVCRSFAQLDTAARHDTRSRISLDEFYSLLTFSRRAAVFALRGSQSDLTDGMTAVSMIEAERVDFRDVIVALGLHHHVGVRVGLDMPRLWRETAARSEPQVAELIGGLLRRSSNEQDIRRLCGLVEVETDDGLGFVRCGYKSYQPTTDLLRVSLELGRLLESDVYQPDDPELASELPKTWFRDERNRGVLEALGTAVASVSLNGRLRPSANPTYAKQQLTAFLVELPESRQARDLLKASRRPVNGFSRLGVAFGSVFCLVVARSFVEGVEPYENAETLSRLGPGIADVLARFGAETRSRDGATPGWRGLWRLLLRRP